MDNRQKIGIGVLVAIVLVGGILLVRGNQEEKTSEVKRQVEQPVETSSGPKNPENVSAITGMECENKDRRPIAVMQPVDRQARPVAGFSQADMVFELPNPADGFFVTRLIGIYQCEIPEKIGSIRSARHDYINVAQSLDAIFVGWGGSAFAINKLNEGVIDNIDCNGQGGKKAPECCYREEATGLMRLEDTGYVKGEKILSCSEEFGYRPTTDFEGYPHQEDASMEDRPETGYLRVGFPGIMEVEYTYDKATNSYLRTWGGVPDTDRNNGKRIAPKNIVVMIAENEQIMANADYRSLGVNDPWEGISEEKRYGPTNISGRYNNIQMGDPWFDTKDSGEAHFYFNGKEYNGTWKKDRSEATSKLSFYDESGQEIQFVPGQIWVEVLVPGQSWRWE